MKEFDSDEVETFPTMVQVKTALVESLLLTSGAVDFLGKIPDNKHIMDFERKN